MKDSNQATYISIMLDTLRKKDSILLNLSEQTRKQTELLENESLDMDSFDATINAKDAYLKELADADEGFLDMYEKVRTVLQENPEDYREEISEAKRLVKRQMEFSVELQSMEERNKQRLSIHLSQGKQKVKDFKVSSRTAAAYYKNMANKHQEGDSYFLDRKN